MAKEDPLLVKALASHDRSSGFASALNSSSDHKPITISPCTLLGCMHGDDNGGSRLGSWPHR